MRKVMPLLILVLFFYFVGSAVAEQTKVVVIPLGDSSPKYTAESPITIEDDVIGLNPASQDGDVLTWSTSGNHWIADRPSTLSVIPHEISNIQPYNTVRFVIATQGVFPSRNAAEPFIAEIMMFGSNFAPRGWLNCDGQLLPINSYISLFALIGTFYGGDGRTTFAVPDLRGRVPIHPGSGPGLTPYSQGQKGGSEKISTHRH